MYNARCSQCLLHLEYVERLSLVRALGCTDDDQLLIKYLEAAIKPDSKIRYTDYQGVYRCRYLGVASTSFLGAKRPPQITSPVPPSFRHIGWLAALFPEKYKTYGKIKMLCKVHNMYIFEYDR